MSNDANDPFHAASQQFTGLAMRANRVLMETAESALGLQLGQLQQSATATSQFMEALSQGNDPAQLLPQGLQLAQDNLQRLGQTGHNLMDLGLRSSQELAELARNGLGATPPSSGKAG
jgi:hypothetical protein